MRFGSALGYLALGFCLFTSGRVLRDNVLPRMAEDRLIASKRSPVTRRAALYGPDLGQMVRDLEREVQLAKRAGHERIVISYAEKLANVFVSMATHTAYPMQVLDQQMPDANRRQRLLDASQRGATVLISLRPPQGWVSTAVDGVLDRGRSGDEDDEAAPDEQAGSE